MSKQEKDVELIPTPPAGWKVKHGSNVGTSPGNYPKIDFGQNSGPHLVIFTLKDVPGVQPTFNADDPIWVQAGNASPTQPGIDTQITDWAIFDGGKTLVLLDSNSQAGDLSYRVKADGYAPPLDPIIRNGGSTSPPQSMPGWTFNEIATAGILVLVAFIAGFFVQRFFAAK
jgi:hypothetical protein